MTKLEKALRTVQREMNKAGRPWVLIYQKTHKQTPCPNIGMLHNGDHITAAGLLVLAQEVAKEPIRVDRIPGIPEEEM